MRKIFFLLACIILFSWWNTHAYYSNAKEIADKIKEYVDSNIPITEQYPFYYNIQTRIKEITNKTPKSDIYKILLLDDINFYIWIDIQHLIERITSRQWALERFILWKKQWILKLQEQEQKLRTNYNIPSNTLVISSQNELSYNNNIYKLHYTIGGNASIFKEWKWFLSVSDISFERKIPLEEIIQEGAKKFFTYSSNIFEEDGYFYTYLYNTYFPIKSNYGIYKSEINNAGYSYDDAVVLRLQDAKNNITFLPKKVPILPRNSFETLTPWIEDFINKSAIDVLRTEKNYEQSYKKIIQTAKDITQGLSSDEEKTRAIYDWMVQNIIYPQKYDLENYAIYSWLEAFENKSAVCEGQALLMYYLLKIAEVKDIQYIDGYVIDAPDFPNVRHAWIRVGEYFYDPSFEKVYQENHKKYFYYKVPHDIMYTNRYTSYAVPERVLEQTKQENQNLIYHKRTRLTHKYSQSDGYKLLDKVFFIKKYNLSSENITLWDIISYLKPQRIDFTKWKLSYNSHLPQNIEYFPIKNLNININSILIEAQYNLNNMQLIKIYRDNIFSTYWISIKN